MTNLYIYIHLVGGIPTPVKNMKVSWDDDSHILWEKKTFQSTDQYIYIPT